MTVLLRKSHTLAQRSLRFRGGRLILQSADNPLYVGLRRASKAKIEFGEEDLPSVETIVRQMKNIKVFKLEERRHLGIVKDIRAGSERYRYLRDLMGTIFGDRRCIVVGSAPNCDAPSLRGDEVIVCVNGSAHNAESFGIQVPDAAFLVSHIFGRSSKHSRATYDLLRGRRARAVMLVTGTLNLERCMESVRDIALGYDRIDELSPFERAAIVGEICGIELGFGTLNQRVSTGVTTAICALWAGAREVNLAGFSLRAGHSYTDYASKRHHVGPDSTFFSLCTSLRLPVTTTSPVLARQFGIPLR